MPQYEPFDPTKPGERVANRFRKQVAELALNAMNDPDYQSIDPVKQIEATMAGVMTGLIGVCFASIRPEGRAEMLQAIIDYVPQAGDNAAEMIDNPIREN